MNMVKAPMMPVPLFESGKIYFCSTRGKWKEAHEALGAVAKMLDRRGAANTFRATDGSPDIYLLGVFDHSVATLAHESAHLVFDICEAVGIDVERGRANETFCHLLDKIVEFGSQYLTANELKN